MLSALEGVLIYQYRLVNLAAAEVDPARLLNVVRPSVTNAWCSQPQLRSYLDLGVTLRAIYSDKDKKPITSFDATRQMCP